MNKEKSNTNCKTFLTSDREGDTKRKILSENQNEEETNDFLCEIWKRINFIEEKMAESNVLVKELIKVCGKSSSPFAGDEMYVKFVVTMNKYCINLHLKSFNEK